MLPIEVIAAKARSDIVTLVSDQRANDCTTGTVVGNAMAAVVPTSYLNAMDRPVDSGEDESVGWLRPSWAAID